MNIDSNGLLRCTQRSRILPRRDRGWQPSLIYFKGSGSSSMIAIGKNIIIIIERAISLAILGLWLFINGFGNIGKGGIMVILIFDL